MTTSAREILEEMATWATQQQNVPHLGGHMSNRLRESCFQVTDPSFLHPIYRKWVISDSVTLGDTMTARIGANITMTMIIQMYICSLGSSFLIWQEPEVGKAVDGLRFCGTDFG
jgi:hypothetical protein